MTDPIRPATILMVEDHPEVLLLGAEMLREAGHAVITAGTADEALAMARAGAAFDLLFTDIVMPLGLDGVALAEEIRRLRPDIPVLLTTGWADPAKSGENSRDAWPMIGKPYRPADLAGRVHALLAGDSGQG